MDLLRFTTAGSVDDGKSTLIGRLLYDTKSIFEDQLIAIEEVSNRKGKEYVDLSLLTDGLRDERAQGITIDVAYRYFATPKRKFIIADTPGHIQYTRNMVTGASTANLAVILVDARKGVIEQTYRHTIIASLLRIAHVVVCVNKMDLVNYDREVFETIKNAYHAFGTKLHIKDIHYIPISALHGDNVVDNSTNMPWYSGPSLLQLIETINIDADYNLEKFRFPVQYVIRPHATQFHDFRGYAGRVESGVLEVGDSIVALNSNRKSKVTHIWQGAKTVEKAYPPMSVTLTLEDEIDISRGDMLVHDNNLPNSAQDLSLMVCWLNEKKMTIGGKYLLRQTTRELKCIVKHLDYKLNINTLEQLSGHDSLEMNEIGKISVKTATPVFFDKYEENKATGSFILIDEFTNETVGAAMAV